MAERILEYQIKEKRNEYPFGWENICKYAEKGCPTAAEDRNYFMEHCVNNGEGCYIKSLEAAKRLRLNPDL